MEVVMIRKEKPIEILVRPTMAALGEVKHAVQTVKEGAFWVVRISVNGKVNQAQRAHNQSDVPLMTKALLRTEHLLGNYSAYTRAATQVTSVAQRPRRPRPAQVQPV
jgi:hypothetical protein